MLYRDGIHGMRNSFEIDVLGTNTIHFIALILGAFDTSTWEYYVPAVTQISLYCINCLLSVIYYFIQHKIYLQQHYIVFVCKIANNSMDNKVF